MPVNALLVGAVIFFMLSIFACALVQADLRTRPVTQVAKAPKRKRRSF